MKKILFSFLMLCAALAHAQTPNSWRADWRNGTNTAYLSKFVQAKPGVECMVFMYSTTASTRPGEPDCIALGPQFVVSSGQITVPVTTGAQGPTGPQGIQGPTGPAGLNGADGQPGTTTWAGITDKPTTYAPSAHTHAIGDVVGLQAAIDGKQAALGYTPYNSTNPAGYVTPAGARGAITLSTTGSGAATYNSGTGVLTIPTPAALPTLATVATTGAYADLTGKPTIPIVPTINRARVTTAADGTYTWTLPTACSGPPVVSITPEGSADVFNHRVVSATATTVAISVTRSQVSAVSLLGLNILSIPATVGATPVHLIAICP